MTYKIMIVDDEPANLRLLERLFRRQYGIISASSGKEALELLNVHDVALIISDQRMPGMTGVEMLKRAAEMRPHTVRIILTGYTDAAALVEAINCGQIYKYVTKPWVNEDLQQTINRALEHYETTRRQHDLANRNERLSARLKEMQHGFVRLIADALDAKDEHAHGQARRSTGYATAIGRRIGLDADELEQLSLAAFLHDIGRIAIPDHIIMKTGALTDDERRIVELHSERGARMLASIPDMNDITAAVRHHHEHFDGTGYPEKLSGAQIPILARIIFVADAYDAMTSPRPFRRAWSHDEAMEQIRSGSGTRFDPQIVAAFCELEAIGRIRRAVTDPVASMSGHDTRVFCDSGEMSLAEVLQKIKTDPVLALDALALANQTRDEDDRTAQLLLSSSRLGEARLRGRLDHHGLPAPDSANADARLHALSCAVAAQSLAAHTGIAHPEDAYTLGLLHDAGAWLLGCVFPDVAASFAHLTEEERLQNQIEMFGVDQAQISQWMLEACGVPRRLTAAVQTLHDVMRINSPIALLLNIAHRIAESDAPYKVAAIDALGTDRLALLGLSRADLNTIYERTRALVEQRREALSELAA